ncbi:hypothetical protein KCU81_g7519, partial [Aureobasidium melanogenum]
MPPTKQTETQDLGDISKQRASKACNRCRVKKARCSGGYPCSRCKSSDALCIFGYPKKSKRKEFPEHYVRTLELQQFKLVAGLQTMYFMLLAANAWPGTRLPESQGNPFIHDILNRLGLLDPESDRSMEMELGIDGDISDEQRTDTDEASISGSPESSQQSFAIASQPCFGSSSALPNCTSFQPQLVSSACDTQMAIHPWQPQSVQLQPHQFSSFPQPLANDFPSRPEGMEIADWDRFNFSQPWWQQNPQTLEAISPANVGSVLEISDINTAADTNDLKTLTTSDSYLVDPGVYACDFDVDH